uniref:C-type lectin domain-containing protein n=1 Tax=Caenorhabditis tropicalis TaxID=1561998 RepID=A0A1I7UKL6_9PELO
MKSLLIIAILVVSTLADCSNEWKALLNGQMEESTSNGCEADWKFVRRPSGGFCMKVFTGFIGDIADAEKACKTVGATLSGLQNKDEALYIQKAILAQVTVDSGSLWTGIKRTDKCMKQKLTATCTNLTSFEWTDGATTGTGGMLFQIGQPDNKDLNQNCALFMASKTPTVIARGTYFAASYEDTGCVVEFQKENIARNMLGYVCLKKAEK